MANGTIQALYDMAKSEHSVDPATGLPKFDEQRLRRELAMNDKLGRRNRDIFDKNEPKYHTCPRYNPCSICDKCQNKASHLYVACQNCQIPICAHTYQDREKMIKPKNFTIFTSKEVMDAIKKLDAEVTGNEGRRPQE